MTGYCQQSALNLCLFVSKIWGLLPPITPLRWTISLAFEIWTLVLGHAFSKRQIMFCEFFLNSLREIPKFHNNHIILLVKCNDFKRTQKAITWNLNFIHIQRAQKHWWKTLLCSFGCKNNLILAPSITPCHTALTD